MSNEKSSHLPATLTISKPSDGFVRLYITDSLSRSRFQVSIDPVAFTDALFGLAGQRCTLEVPNLQCVGKKRIVERRSTVYKGKHSHDRAYLEQWLKENRQEDGWELDPSLRSQGSISYGEGMGRSTLNYRVYKFVQASEAEIAEAAEYPGF